MQPAAPVFGMTCPRGQLKQPLVACVCGMNVPGLHCVHTIAPVFGMYCPGRQS
jgi:hypothetical protein